ncbi:MAG: hypothetical protein DRQ64_09450 [Gammaproteobacteria bacterium]|nr:MAG: hypothetical protein DRQ64_09450 [Gammaproteobacteria bacterium]
MKSVFYCGKPAQPKIIDPLVLLFDKGKQVAPGQQASVTGSMARSIKKAKTNNPPRSLKLYFM